MSLIARFRTSQETAMSGTHDHATEVHPTLGLLCIGNLTVGDDFVNVDLCDAEGSFAEIGIPHNRLSADARAALEGLADLLAADVAREARTQAEECIARSTRTLAALDATTV